ncbi:hypothetical protein C3Y87_02980 [Carbonactinospora thermoautotrophica]|nr:hypothetical protein [Carbonactinospora thermoautotrophica]
MPEAIPRSLFEGEDVVFGRIRGRRDGGGPDGVDAPPGYSQLEEIDHGGFSVVYRAHQDRFDRVVALKILTVPSLDEKAIRRFEMECRTMGRLSNHPNIVTVYDAGVTPMRRPYLAMEYCSGGSLQRRVDHAGPLDVAETLRVGIKIAGALHAAHQEGILHRDIKPQNILYTSFGEPALADFGIAQMAQPDATVTSAGFTIAHCAPEILEGKPASVATDVYAFGSTLYALLAGEPPFATEARAGLAPLIQRIMRNELPPLPRTDVPDALLEILYRSMSINPAERFQTAAEMGEALARVEPPKSAAGPAVFYRPDQATTVQPDQYHKPEPVYRQYVQPPRLTDQYVAPQAQPAVPSPTRPPDQYVPVQQPAPNSPPASTTGDSFLTPPSWERRDLKVPLIVAGAAAGLLAVGGLVWALLPDQGGEEPEFQAVQLPPDARAKFRPTQVTARSAGGKVTLRWSLPDAARQAGTGVLIQQSPGQQITLPGLPTQHTVTLPSKDRFCFTVAVLLDPAKSGGHDIASSSTTCVAG